jgi:hypothetical protein
VKDITQNPNVAPKQLDINGKVIPSRVGHKGTQDSRKKWSGYIKRCKVEFSVKTLCSLKHVLELCFIQRNHFNQDG